MGWGVCITNDAKQDFKKLDGSVKKQVLAGILKVSQAPMPSPNGYGKPLGNKAGNNLTGFFKIKYKEIGIRVVYTIIPSEMVMSIIVISKRDDEYCYNLTATLHAKYGDEIFKDIFETFKPGRKNKKK